MFRSVPDLIAAIEVYLKAHDGDPEPLVRTAATADQIIAKANRQKTSDTRH